MSRKRFIIAFCLLFLLISVLLIIFFINYFYPIKYIDDVENASIEFNVDKALILSIIQAESGFDKNAISSAGAVGLMQLMPSTATYIANKVNYYKIIDLTNATCNIYLGTAYISYLQNKFNTLRQVLCAYNAGENIVSKWIEDDDELKTIPYKETNNYVKKIQFAYKIYCNKVEST